MLTGLRGITSTVSVMLCASAAGSWIDRAPSRLPPLLVTICANHGAIVCVYLCWLLWPILVGFEEDNSDPDQRPLTVEKALFFGIILLLDVLQELGAIANRLSVERDWVPVLVGPVTPHTKYGLTQVNAVMRRIDFVCKLVAPSLLPLVVAIFTSRATWILLLAGSTVVLWAAEICCARIIARENPQLRALKNNLSDEARTEDDIEGQSKPFGPDAPKWPQQMYTMVVRGPIVRLKQYFAMPVWPASMSMALIQLTVLAYSATLITYLLEVGFSLTAITIARASGAMTALASTFITPYFVDHLRKRQSLRSVTSGEQENQDDTGEGIIVRKVGLWGIMSQFLSLVRSVLF